MKKFFLTLIGKLAIVFASITIKSIEKRASYKAQQIDEIKRLVDAGKAELQFDETTKKFKLVMK